MWSQPHGFWEEKMGSGLFKKTLAVAALAMLMGTASASATNVAWVHSNAAAQSEQRAKAGFDAWLKETNKDWSISVLDSGGSGERTGAGL